MSNGKSSGEPVDPVQEAPDPGEDDLDDLDGKALVTKRHVALVAMLTKTSRNAR